MLCVHGGPGGDHGVSKTYMPLKVDLTDIVLTIFVSPLVWLFVTRAPVLATIVFSSVLITA